jgi:type I restriction enzyme S subunit
LAYAIQAKSTEILGLVDEASHGTGRLQTETLQGVEVPLPPLAEQRVIAHILGSLDDKIDLNRRMNRTLEEIARALFQSWFVDFDPVHAHARGETMPGLDPALDALFPAAFEDSALGPIPVGWRVGMLDSILTLYRQTINPSTKPNQVFEHYSIPALDSGYPTLDLGYTIKSGKQLVPGAAVLLSKINPRFPRVWLVAPDQVLTPICSTEFFVCIAVNGFSLDYIYSMFSTASFARDFASLASGTSSSHQRVQRDAFLNMLCVVPPKPVISSFTELTSPLFAMTRSLKDEARTLAALRDTLLPKLMSGDLRVAAAEIAEAAA